MELAPYPALSGQRLAAELERLVADARPAVALTRLGRAGVFRLVDPRYRFTRRTADGVAAFDESLAWTAVHGLTVPPFALALAALLTDQPRSVAGAFLERLALRGEPLFRLLHALDEHRGRPAGGRTTANAGLMPLALATDYLTGSAGVRARLTSDVAATRAEKGELRGDELIELGVPRGPAVGTVLEGIRGRRRRGEIADRAAEIDYVRSWVSERNRDDEREG